MKIMHKQLKNINRYMLLKPFDFTNMQSKVHCFWVISSWNCILYHIIKEYWLFHTCLHCHKNHHHTVFLHSSPLKICIYYIFITKWKDLDFLQKKKKNLTGNCFILYLHHNHILYSIYHCHNCHRQSKLDENKLYYWHLWFETKKHWKG